ncbi:MAG: hypothetical protein JW830_10505 [Bacteroidales bacterium]|nr:hypothetical protein [Bacteroidales bacterium]
MKDNICQFIGEIEIIHIRKFVDSYRSGYLMDAEENQDEDVIKRFTNQKYILLANYELFEDQKQGGSGRFKGILETRFYLNGEKILYDNLDIESDDFYNNQFVGNWESYKNMVVKKCNWGDFRIPYSNDLDIGIGEFSPSEKHLNNGWLNYYKAYTLQDMEAKKVEDYKWW